MKQVHKLTEAAIEDYGDVAMLFLWLFFIFKAVFMYTQTSSPPLLLQFIWQKINLSLLVRPHFISSVGPNIHSSDNFYVGSLYEMSWPDNDHPDQHFVPFCCLVLNFHLWPFTNNEHKMWQQMNETHISGILAKRHLVMQQQNHLTELKCRAKNNIRKRTWRICIRDISKQQSDITDIRVSGNRCMCLMKMKMPIMESLKAGLRTNGSICFF